MFFPPVSGIRSLHRKYFVLNFISSDKSPVFSVQPGGEKLETDKLQGGEDKLLSFVPVTIPQILFINFHNLKNALLLIRNLQCTCRVSWLLFLPPGSYIWRPFTTYHSYPCPAQRVHCDKFIYFLYSQWA